MNFLRARRAPKLARLRRFYQSGVDRIQGSWAGQGVTGEEFHEPPHLYETALNILGEGSLFELLCTARTQAGRRRLASYLLSLPSPEETRARQEAVKELQPESAL